MMVACTLCFSGRRTRKWSRSNHNREVLDDFSTDIVTDHCDGEDALLWVLNRLGPWQFHGPFIPGILKRIPASKVGSDDYSKTSAPGDLNIKALGIY